MTLSLPASPLVETFPDDATWLAGRSAAEHQIGGSDIAAILNRCPPGWGRGPWTLWARSRGLETKGFNAAQRRDLDRGNRWERFILSEEWAKPKGYTLHLNGERTIIRHRKHAWATVSPDDFATTPDRGLVYAEVKTARQGDALFGEDGTVIEAFTGESVKLLPVYYALQVLWGLHLTGLSWAAVIVAIPTSGDWPDIRTIWLRAQPELQAHLFDDVAAARDRYMVRGEEPPVDGTDDCGFALTQLFPKPERKTYRPAVGEVHELALRRAALAEEQKRIADEYKAAGHALQRAIGEDYGLTVDLGGDDKPGKVIAVRQSGRESVDLASIRADHPDLLEAMQKRGLLTTGDPFVQIRTYGL